MEVTTFFYIVPIFESTLIMKDKIFTGNLVFCDVDLQVFFTSQDNNFYMETQIGAVP